MAIIKKDNETKIAEIISKAEGRATARTITVKDMLDALECVEKTLGIHKKDMIGITVDIDVNAQDFPNAYKYTPESTQFRAIYKKSGWDLIAVSRERTRSARRTYIIEHTAESKKAIIDRMSIF